MKLTTPKIDGRTFERLLEQALALAPSYTPEWAAGQSGEPGQALLNIYLRLQEHVLSRLNRVPDKNLVAFLDMMGVKLLPAQSAQARVTFTLANGATEHVLVPRGTLMSGEGAGGGGQVIFQTQQDLLVTPAALRRAFSFDVSDDGIYDHAQDPKEPQPFVIFDGTNLQEHSLYLGHADLLNQKKPTRIDVDFLLSTPASEGSDLSVVWEYNDGTRWAEIERFERTRGQNTDGLKDDDNDETRLFTRSGTMHLVKAQTAEIAETPVMGIKNRWIRCRLIKKLSGGAPVQLPSIDTVRVSVQPSKPFAADLAFNNDIPLNLTEVRVKMLAMNSDFSFTEDLPPPEPAPPGDRTQIKITGHADNLFPGDVLALHNGLDEVEIREVAEVAADVVTLKEALRFDYEKRSSKVILFTALRPKAGAGTEGTVVRVKSDEDLKPYEGSRATLFHGGESESAKVTKAAAGDKVKEVTSVSIGTGDEVKTFDLTLDERSAPARSYVEGDALELTPRITPFGKLPVVFDTFYVASDEAFSKKGAQVTLHLDGEWSGYKDANPSPAPDPVLSWEYWNGKSWRGLRVVDTTDRFKNQNATVVFTCPEDIEKVEVNGEEKFWIRVRLIDGDYGKELIIVEDPLNSNQVKIKPGKVFFPIISNLLISYEGVGALPQKCVTANNLNLEDHTADSVDLGRTFEPFAAMPEESSGLFLGFDKALRGGPLGILFDLEEQLLKQDERLRVVWSYWKGDAWEPLTPSDETESLTRVGVLEFLVGRDFARSLLFGQELFWMKGSFVEGKPPHPLRIKSLHPNTTHALQADVADNELVGSSKGTADQEFTLQHPLVISQQVYVRESVRPTAEEQKAIVREEGRDAIRERKNELGETVEILVRWHAVEDFDASGPQSRHYTIDQRLGKLKFGDGTRGMVPPTGADNIIASYTFGGGKQGNVAVKAISGLKSAVPFVKGVTNPLAADGGSETETLSAALTRGPLLLKNRNRAVTPEDFEALARGASRKVARAKCLPNVDADRGVAPGRVTLMIVPDSDETRPTPTQQLVQVVKNGLEKFSANVVSSPRHINVIGPDYTEIVVEVTVVPTSIEKAAAAEASLGAKLNRYIHPLTGGPCETGWEFGRDICLSDIIALAEGVEEVDHVEKLVLFADGRAHEGDVPLDRYALPVSGEHRITVALDGQQSSPDRCRSSQTECAPGQEFKPTRGESVSSAQPARPQPAQPAQQKEVLS